MPDTYTAPQQHSWLAYLANEVGIVLLLHLLHELGRPRPSNGPQAAQQVLLAHANTGVLDGHSVGIPVGPDADLQGITTPLVDRWVGQAQQPAAQVGECKGGVRSWHELSRVAAQGRPLPPIRR